ncbi:hypothetical protein EBZ37_10110 [bacterium]|nr:hypothetical protein [bacterium]
MFGDSKFFEAFYSGIWQQPVSLWIVLFLGTLRAWGGLGSIQGSAQVRRFIFGWALVSAMDAWLTANVVLGFGPLSGGWASGVPLFFVIVGDLRVFWALEYWGVDRFRGEPRLIKSALHVVFASLVVPVLMHITGADQKDPRILFLVYELCFLAWILIYGWIRFRPLASRSRECQFAWRFIRYVCVYYSLWALADLWILATSGGARDLGFALRVIPNWLYYGTWGWALIRTLSASQSVTESTSRQSL